LFTGLVQDVGRIVAARRVGAGLDLEVRHALPGEPVEPGESIAVDGCCLTVTITRPGSFRADLSPETLARTGGSRRWRPGREVHLERALRAGDRMGGHLVQGHVDQEVRVLGLRRVAGGGAVLRVELPRGGRPLVVEKGSVALDGVSLTVARLGGGWFEVALVPETLARTTLGRRRPGDRLCVEWDVMLKAAAAGRGR